MLSILASIYAKVADMRNTLYDKGVLDIFDTGARTISIGNITAGGTGKTPLVAYVARVLAERGDKVCILTRGYGRIDPAKRVVVTDGEKILVDPRTAGDEPFELAQKLLGKAIVIADADRVAAAEMALREYGATALVLDDGFQHRKVKRDLDIVCIDATDPFGGGKMLPAGRLREPIHNLSRADIVVITRSDLIEDAAGLKAEIEALSTDSKVFVASTEIVEIADIGEFHAKPQRTPRGDEKAAAVSGGPKLKPGALMKVGAFCGVGNPRSFFDQLRAAKFDVVSTRIFADHHVYTQADVIAIEKQARDDGAEFLVTTAKDAVKLKDLTLNLPCFVIEIEMVIENADDFDAML